MTTQPGDQCRLGERDLEARRPAPRPFLRALLSAAGTLLLLATALPARATITSDVQPETGYYGIVNTIVGADAFYNNGYFGQTAVVANVEAGLVWGGQESFDSTNISYFYDPSTAQPQPNYDGHATAVGSILAALGPPTFIEGQAYFQYYQFGMAPAANLWSAAIATQFHPGTGSFETTAQAIRYAYQTVMTQTVIRQIGGNLYFSSGADVINSSWGFADPTGSDSFTQLIDAITYTYAKTLVVAAGNTQNPPPVNQVTGPASGFNSIAVAALTGDMTQPLYSGAAPFSNTGPNDFYNPQTGVTLTGVRPGVDIAAPGTDLILAAYTGATGDNTGGTDPYNGENDLYYIGAAGTSFAAPIVAGGATLVADAGWQNFGGGTSVDGRVIKAVLMNSADKLAGWTNNTMRINGVLTTTQALDYSTGTGALNLTHAYSQYLSGTTDVPGLGGGTVLSTGWDFGQITAATCHNDYAISTPLHATDICSVTLDWFVEMSFDPTADTSQNIAFFNLDLQVFEQTPDGAKLIAQSISLYNNVQYLYFELPDDGNYFLRVLWGGTVYDIPGDTPQQEDYGLAWSITPLPEPASLAMMALVIPILLRRRRRAV